MNKPYQVAGFTNNIGDIIIRISWNTLYIDALNILEVGQKLTVLKHLRLEETGLISADDSIPPAILQNVLIGNRFLFIYLFFAHLRGS